MSTSGGSGGGGLSVATAHLTAAEIATLFSAPTEIVAAPGDDRALVVVGGFIEYAPTSGGWDDGGGGIESRIYYGPNGPASGQGWAASCVLDAAWLAVPASDGAQTMSIAAQADDGSQPDPLANVADAPFVVSMKGDPAGFGTIATTSIAAAGAGYAPGDTGTVDDPHVGAATGYVIDTVGALGIVLTFHLALSTSGYDDANNPHTTTAGGAQPGIGAGLQINILTVAVVVADLYVTVFYRTVTTH